MDNRVEQARNLLIAGNESYRAREFSDALKTWDAAWEGYATEPLLSRPELDGDRANTQFNRALALKALGNSHAALEAYGHGWKILQNASTTHVPDLDVERASLQVNRGVLLRALGDLSGAIAAYDLASTIYSGRNLQGRDDLNLKRARLQLNRGMALLDLGTLAEALAALDESSSLYATAPLKLERKLDVERVRLQINRGVVLADLGDLTGALDAYDAASRILEGPLLRGRTEFDPERAGLQVNRGRALNLLGDARRALQAFDRAMLLYESDTLKQRLELVPARASLQLNRGSAFHDLGELKKAIEAYGDAWALYEGSGLRDRKEFDPRRAKVQTNLGLVLRAFGDFDGALAAYQEAWDLYEGAVLHDRRDLDAARARLLANRGVLLATLGREPDALAALDAAMNLHKTAPALARDELDFERASILLNRGNVLLACGKTVEAREDFEEAAALHEGPTVGPWLPRDSSRCRLYASMSHLFSEMTPPHSWARDKSGRMSGMLELAPPEGVGPWSEMRSSFRSFHERWLGYAVREGHVEPIPEILAALQGRDVAADMLDRLAQEAADDAGTDAALAAYQAARAELRRLAESIRDDGAGAFGFDDGPGGGARGAWSDGGAALPPGARNAREAKLLEEYRALHDKLPALREAAAEVPGFEILRAPHRQVTQAWLRESLGADEAMLLAFVHDGVARAAVLLGDGDGALVDLPAFADKAADMERFSRSLSGRGGLRDGGWSHAAEGGDVPAGAAAADRMTEAELAAFWDATGEAQRAQLWALLTEALDGAKRVIGITHGRLQLAALSAGAPEDAEIVQYPGLAFYALARGLYGDRTEPAKPAANRSISIVRGDHADLQYSPLEEQASVALWRSAGAEVSHPDYPHEGRVGLLHVTSHGDLLDDGSPVILLGSDRTIGERDILRGPPIEAAFLNLCLGGRLSEDPLDGSPSGLVSALMRRGAKVVVAALPPVDDLWACVLGLIVTEAMATEGNPLDRALALAKRRLGDGVPESVIASLKDWYMARLDHVVREHAYSHRRKPEACARAALKAAFGTDDDTMLLTDLTAALADVPDRDRPATAAQFLAAPAWAAFEARLARGPGPAEHGALVHGMIAFGESTHTS